MVATTHNTEPYHVILGPKLRLEMQRESRRLTAQWKLAVSTTQRREIARRILAIDLLLGQDTALIIGRSANG